MELPPELRMEGREIKIAIDVVCINNESFLHSLDRTIKHNELVVLGTQRKGESHKKEMLYRHVPGLGGSKYAILTQISP